MTTTGTPVSATAVDRTQDVGAHAHPGQRDLAGPLDHRTVDHRIGVREADLDQVDAGLDQRPYGSMPPATVGKPAGR